MKLPVDLLENLKAVLKYAKRYKRMPKNFYANYMGERKGFSLTEGRWKVQVKMCSVTTVYEFSVSNLYATDWGVKVRPTKEMVLETLRDGHINIHNLDSREKFKIYIPDLGV